MYIPEIIFSKVCLPEKQNIEIIDDKNTTIGILIRNKNEMSLCHIDIVINNNFSFYFIEFLLYILT